MKRTAILALLLAPALFYLHGQERNAKMPAKDLKYTEGTYFTVTLPQGWERRESAFGLTAKEKKVFGVEVYGPTNADNIFSMISVHYYAPGNIVHRTYEKFIKRNIQSALGANIDGKQYGKIKNGEVAGRGAKLFERITYEYIPPESIKQKKVPVYEHFAVVPAKAGFYVLEYYAPKEIAKTNIKAFEDVLDSFVPLVK